MHIMRAATQHDSEVFNDPGAQRGGGHGERVVGH
jgi:hypothetical protein